MWTRLTKLAKFIFLEHYTQEIENTHYFQVHVCWNIYQNWLYAWLESKAPQILSDWNYIEYIIWYSRIMLEIIFLKLTKIKFSNICKSSNILLNNSWV